MRWRGVAAVAAAASMVACLDLSTDVEEVTSIALVPPERTSVIAGDALRAFAGDTIVLEARVYRADGSLVPDAEVIFFSRDTTIARIVARKVLGDSNAIGKFTTIIATTEAGGTLQSIPQRIDVTARPDTAIPNVTLTPAGTVTPLEYLLPDSPQNVSIDLGLLLQGRDSSRALKGSQGFIVTFRLLRRDGSVVPAGDTSQVYLQNPANGRAATDDTTDASGLAARRVRLVAANLQAAIDTFTVEASASYGGAPVKGSPVRLRLPIRPRGSP